MEMVAVLTSETAVRITDGVLAQCLAHSERSAKVGRHCTLEVPGENQVAQLGAGQ